MNTYGYVGGNPVNAYDPYGLVSISSIKEALKIVHQKLGGSLPKGKPGKFGSPQRGDAKKGYRLDPGHDRNPNSPESGPHINWWDYTKGKRGKGGESDAVPIKDDGFVTLDILFGLLGTWGIALTPSTVACGYLDCDGDGLIDFNGQPMFGVQPVDDACPN